MRGLRLRASRPAGRGCRVVAGLGAWRVTDPDRVGARPVKAAPRRCAVGCAEP